MQVAIFSHGIMYAVFQVLKIGARFGVKFIKNKAIVEGDLFLGKQKPGKTKKDDQEKCFFHQI